MSRRIVRLASVALIARGMGWILGVGDERAAGGASQIIGRFGVVTGGCDVMGDSVLWIWCTC